MNLEFRLFDFHVFNETKIDEDQDPDDNDAPEKDMSVFTVQMFGVNEQGQTCSITVNEFRPFFYVKVHDNWTRDTKERFLLFMKSKVGKFYENSITECKIIERKKLYGFDNGKLHKFVRLEFSNMTAFNKAKQLWYDKATNTLLKDGLIFNRNKTELYEANIPPLLRFFHIKEISPSGWIALPKRKVISYTNPHVKKTTCDFELVVNYKDIIALNEKETPVPLKIMSFDIEASSSHGDFPVPVKSYKKLATNIIDFFDKEPQDSEKIPEVLRQIIQAAFHFEPVKNIDLVYTKCKVFTLEDVNNCFEKWMKYEVRLEARSQVENAASIEHAFLAIQPVVTEETEDVVDSDSDGEEEVAPVVVSSVLKKRPFKKMSAALSYNNVVSLLEDTAMTREQKIMELNVSLCECFPPLEGDKVTFIGSTFMYYGQKDPHFNHCICLNTCDPVENAVIETALTERQLLLKWQQLVMNENPDIIIGYNIFGFDYEFLFRRAIENNCVSEFLQLSRNKSEVCAQWDKNKNQYKIEETSIQIASGQHDLRFVKMTGRLQVDLYNFFRREENLTSYKLDYVAGHFIGDYVKDLSYTAQAASSFLQEDEYTEIKTGNMTGLLVGSYVHFEEIAHSVDYYDDGNKFLVTYVNKEESTFRVNKIIQPDMKKKVRWCLAKDDVTPKDIFEMTNGTSADRAIIAKYCIQDCNLVNYLFNKADILTGFVEMAKICSVPINFLVMRGQGIKLTSYISKKCREKRTLMPVLDKGDVMEAYEGAIVLDPKSDLYLDNPVACVDYASLYPSSMISENLSHDSKVWTKEYDKAGNLLSEWGEKDPQGNFIYDNLPGLEYVTVTYSTYSYIRNSKNPNAKPKKVHTGRKVCRFVQPISNNAAIMPSILKELLLARKTTRKLIPDEKDEFMKNVLDKRQLGYKVTANSLYGQCGAKTSTFYEKDIAACTTATGQLLLTYAKKIIEQCYGDNVCQTSKWGTVCTKAEYIYGDSVASYTPVYVRYNKSELFILSIEEVASKFGNNIWITRDDKEFCEVSDLETWTETGWTKLYRVIRHNLVPEKKMIRILTHSGIVDVTDDHSLLLQDKAIVSPKDLSIGDKLLHQNLPESNILNDISLHEAKIFGFFFGDGSCGRYLCPSGQKSSWALNNANDFILNKYLDLCRLVYPTFEWVVLPTLESSGVYKICPKSNSYGGIVAFVTKYRNLLYSGNAKVIPNQILNGTVLVKEAFFEGFYDADGDKDIAGYQRFDQKNQISCAHLTFLSQSLGYEVSLNTRIDKPNIYRMTLTKSTQRKDPAAIKKIQELSYGGYVYDLTTENHHFAAGIGKIIVHNTDSVFFTFNLQQEDGTPIRGKEALEITIELAQEAGHLASKFLKQPHDLEYEKTFMPFCLLSKKRYVGMLYETDPKKCKRKEMGIVLKRRDNAPIVKDVYGGIIDILMKSQNVNESIMYLKNCLKNLVEEKYPMEKLIITKSLRSDYKNPKTIAHKVLADRIAERDPGNKPGPGDRIPFVYVSIPGLKKDAKQGEKIETPTFILENKLKIDYSFYITNQIMKPVQQVFALVLLKMWESQNKLAKIMVYKKEVAALRKKHEDDDDKFEKAVEKLKNKEVKALLFDEFLRETDNAKKGNQSLAKFGFFGKK
jgi:DNA polymerase elongation subunit (family B)